MKTLPRETAFASIRTLAEGLRRGEFTSVELTQFYLDRLQTWGKQLRAVVNTAGQAALERANRLDRELTRGQDRGLLHGIPYAVKDLFSSPDMPTTWGASPYRDRVLPTEATAIARLTKSGGVLCAKLAMIEFAGGLGYRDADACDTGPCSNPWNVTRWSGGSSSGSAAAVAAGLVPFTLGTETWGSITNPAAFCGVSALRPTYGRVSRHGAMTLSWTMDKAGPFCRTADDCGIVMHALAGADPDDDSTVDVPFQFTTADEIFEKNRPRRGRYRLAVLKGSTARVQPEVRENFAESLVRLADFADLEAIELPDFPYNTLAGTISASETAAAFEELITSGVVWELTSEDDHWGLHSALVIPAKDYINAMRIRRLVQHAMDELLSQYDAIVTPTWATVAYPMDQSFRDYRGGYTNTPISAVGNLAGLPAITVPNGVGEAGLPTGLQFVGRAFADELLLALAGRYQQLTTWHEQFPPEPAEMM